MALHRNTFVVLTDHFSDPFDRENVEHVFDIVVHYDRKFDADAILYGDTMCKKMDISMFLPTVPILKFHVTRNTHI